MINIYQIKKILGLRSEIELSSKEMAHDLKVTFLSVATRKLSIHEKEFMDKLISSMEKLGVEVLDFEDNLTHLSWRSKVKRVGIFLYVNKQIFSHTFRTTKSVYKSLKSLYLNNFWNFIFGKKLKKDIAIFTFLRENELLAMDFTNSFKRNPIVTLVYDRDFNKKNLTFNEHADLALNLFADTMSNLIVQFNESNWMLYSFNMSNPVFDVRSENFTQDILDSLLTKVYAPVVPPSLDDFNILKDHFDFDSEYLSPYISDMVDAGPIFDESELFPKGKDISELLFRNPFYRWIGSLHLDKRNGMSYGFLARQLPVSVAKLAYEKNEIPSDFYDRFGDFYLEVNVAGKDLLVGIPEVWVLTTRSGANKTKLDKAKDVVKMGIYKGQMMLQMPKGIELSANYRPSFDSRVILSHAVANVVVAAIDYYFHRSSLFAHKLVESGLAICHWHGSVDVNSVDDAWLVYGQSNPSVSCSALQGAIYAMQGKLESYLSNLPNEITYIGDVHVEPHHGINVTFSSLVDLAKYVTINSDFTKLGV